MWKLAGGVLVGWGLGSNDSANIFGTGVAANAIRYRTAIFLIAVFVVIGALVEGHKTMATVGEMSTLSHTAAFIAALATGLTVSVFSYLALPVSTSQAIIGAVLGIGLISGIPDFTRLYKVVICWVLTPFAAIALSLFLYPLLASILRKALMDLKLRNGFLRWGLVFAGCYGAYSLGANNVANVTGVYVGSGLLAPFEAALLGSLGISFGVLTYSRKVMGTVGKRIVHLDEFSAFVSELSAAITVHVFTQVGVPVSTSQAIVGGVTGVGLVKGLRTVRKKTLVGIVVGWVSTPLLCGVISYLMMKLYLSFSGVGA